MGKPSKAIARALAWGVFCVVLASCNSQKQPAQAAYAQVEASVAPVRESLEKYAAEEYETLNAVMDAMRARLNAGDYQAALDLQPKVMAQLAAAAAVAAQKRNQLASMFGGEWRALSATLPRQIKQLKVRVDELQAGGGKLPSGVARDAVQRAQAALLQFDSQWKVAASAALRNDMAAAVTQGREIKKRIQEVAAGVGIKLLE